MHYKENLTTHQCCATNWVARNDARVQIARRTVSLRRSCIPYVAFLIVPVKGKQLSPQQQEFNIAMSSVRESVEWNFGRTKTQWAFVDFKKQKVMLSPVRKVVKVSMLLTNCHCYFHRGP
ncbi:TPA: hypothetical protein N0F65_010715, partial [Lagenidium giganteum]